MNFLVTIDIADEPEHNAIYAGTIPQLKEQKIDRLLIKAAEIAEMAKAKPTEFYCTIQSGSTVSTIKILN